ncbi:helix-turn-helix transcriptional regulator [Clostridium butyricum]|uniref:helix-turn-helix transcriptional regulator n=1 Tax=Clostridium butyricum TaxID=1492 RepID=UPI002ABE603A|nr:DNA-binding response regulator [Clostridium butyricum]
MLDKEQVKNLYLDGLNAVQIAQRLSVQVETVRKCIQRNHKKFKVSHKASKIRNKEVKKITEYEAKQFMSDAVFIKKNRSIYKTNKDGDIVLDKSIAPVVSFDTPRILKNENSIESVNRKISKSNYRKENIV